MNRPGSRVWARSAFLALAALLLVGWIHSAAAPTPIVAAGDDELDRFAPVDMAEAVKRAAIAN